MTNDELEHFLDMSKRARDKFNQSTSGNWEYSHASTWSSGKRITSEYFVRLEEGDTAIASEIINPDDEAPSEANAAFIAYAHNNMESMATVIERLVEEVKTYKRVESDVWVKE